MVNIMGNWLNNCLANDQNITVLYIVHCYLFQRNMNHPQMRLNALWFKHVHTSVPMGSTLAPWAEKHPIWPALYIQTLLKSACRQACNNTHSDSQTLKNLPLFSQKHWSHLCPFPNWWFFFQRSDYARMCLEQFYLCKVSRFSPSLAPEGTKEAPVTPLGARGRWHQ